MRTTDEVIDHLGIELLRELNAIAWFCDAGDDGKMPLIPTSRRRSYEPGGPLSALVECGCVKLLSPTYCTIIGRYYPAIRMLQFGRKVLSRARAKRLNLKPSIEERDSE